MSPPFPSIQAAAADLISRAAKLYVGTCPCHRWRAVRQDLERGSSCWLALPVFGDGAKLVAWYVFSDRPLDHLDEPEEHPPEAALGILAGHAIASLQMAGKGCASWLRTEN